MPDLITIDALVKEQNRLFEAYRKAKTGQRDVLLTVMVEADHIAMGEPKSPDSCPIALALADVTEEDATWEVGVGKANVRATLSSTEDTEHGERRRSCDFELLPSAWGNMLAFDMGRDILPFTVQLVMHGYATETITRDGEDGDEPCSE